MNIQRFLGLCLLIVFGMGTIHPPQVVRAEGSDSAPAQQVSAYELILAMNTLRVAYGLPALIEDPIVDASVCVCVCECVCARKKNTCFSSSSNFLRSSSFRCSSSFFACSSLFFSSSRFFSSFFFCGRNKNLRERERERERQKREREREKIDLML